jgi:FtsZ-interacting cell division protein YlmF
MAANAKALQKAVKEGLAAPSPEVTVRLVPDLAWQGVKQSQMARALQQGVDGYIESLQDAIVRDTGDLIVYQLASWFGQQYKQTDARLIKKLANSASSPGMTAFRRTADYVSQLPKWDELSSSPKSLSAVRETLSGNYDVEVKLTSEKNLKCSTCKLIIPKDSLNIEEDRRSAGETKENWHSACWVASALREISKEHRAAKGALDKQSRSVRAILKSSPKSLWSSALITNKSEYEQWLLALVDHWRKVTNVDEAFHNLYEKNFMEYAEQLSDFHLTGKLSVPKARNRLSKHLGMSHVESVLESFLNSPGKAIEYTGAVNPSLNSMPVNASVREAPAVTKIYNCTPVVFADSRDVGTHLVAGTPVLMNLSEANEQESKRIIDFASGITFALGGTIERVTPKVFMLTPPGVELHN